MRAVVVIPTYNEHKNLLPLVEAVWEAVPSLHILIVDDNSPDGTGQLADTLRDTYPERLFVLHRTQKTGLGDAYKAGFRYVLDQGYQLIVQMDADLSHDPKVIPEFLARAAHADLVIGSRYLGGIRVVNWDFKRLVLSKTATRYINIVTGLPFTDITGGFKCWRRATLEQIDLDHLPARGYVFQVETTYRAFCRKFTIAEVPIIFYERRLGESKIEPGIIWEAFTEVLQIAFRERVVKKFGFRKTFKGAPGSPALSPVATPPSPDS